MRRAVFAFALIMTSYSLVSVAQERRAGLLVWTPATFETREGPKQSVSAENGTLFVEEDWSSPNGRTIGLHMVRFKATTKSPRAPIVYLAGGPGGSGILSASGDRFPLFMELRTSADVIALDQRGVRSDPFPSCPGAFQLPFDRPGGAEAWLPVLRTASAACVEKWKDRFDLATLDAVSSARDLDALRRALGVPRLNLLGISYGTHLGIAVAREFPDLPERMVLAGVEGPDDTLKLPSALDAHLAAVAAVVDSDPTRAGKPPLLAVFKQAMDRLRPGITVAVRGRSAPITLGIEDLRMATLEMTSERHNLEEFPARVSRIAAGDFSELGAWAAARRSLPGLLPMAYVNDCASGSSPERRARIAREAPDSLMGQSFNLPFPDICDIWPHRDLGAEFRAPLTSDVPTLFISGSLDGRTPRANADAVRAGFRNGQSLLLDPAGHDDDLLIAIPEIGKIIAAFFRGEGVASKLTLPPLKFTR